MMYFQKPGRNSENLEKIKHSNHLLWNWDNLGKKTWNIIVFCDTCKIIEYALIQNKNYEQFLNCVEKKVSRLYVPT